MMTNGYGQGHVTHFNARRCADAVYMLQHVSVRVSVCHKPVLYQSCIRHSVLVFFIWPVKRAKKVDLRIH